MNINNINPALAGSEQIAKFFVLCALISALSTSAAVAGAPQTNAGKEPVTITLSMKQVVVDAKGNETLKDAPRIKPGDLVEYAAVYRNRSSQGISGLKATLPVPVGLEYVRQTAKPAPVMATTDGVKFAVEPLMRTVKDQVGKEQLVEVPCSEYRNLRWEVGDLDAGKRVVVSARMRVIALPKTPEELVTKKPVTPILVK